MTDDLRTRIAAAIYNACDDYTRKLLVRPDCPGASEVEGEAKPMCYALADAVIRELQLDDTVRLLRASRVWIADAISEDPSGEPWLMTRTLLNQLVSRVDSLGGWADE